MFQHGLAWRKKMSKKPSFQQSQTWYEGYTQVFENAKFLGDLAILVIKIYTPQPVIKLIQCLFSKHLA